MRARRWTGLYLAWMVICAIAFVALRRADDPSRKRDALLSNDAGRMALTHLRQHDRQTFREYEFVHVARSGDRWIVLCDRVPHSALSDAIVVKLRAADGALIRFRRPIH